MESSASSLVQLRRNFNVSDLFLFVSFLNYIIFMQIQARIHAHAFTHFLLRVTRGEREKKKPKAPNPRAPRAVALTSEQVSMSKNCSTVST